MIQGVKVKRATVRTTLWRRVCSCSHEGSVYLIAGVGMEAARQDRLYVNTLGGRTVAWFDRRTGHRDLDKSLPQPILDALTPHVTRTAALSIAAERTRRAPLPKEYDLTLRGPGDA